MTGKQGFNSQLTVREIMNQIISIPESAKLTNLVFMGMGEPLDNLDEVMTALTILTAKWGFAWSPKKNNSFYDRSKTKLNPFFRRNGLSFGCKFA